MLQACHQFVYAIVFLNVLLGLYFAGLTLLMWFRGRRLDRMMATTNATAAAARRMNDAN